MTTNHEDYIRKTTTKDGLILSLSDALTGQIIDLNGKPVKFITRVWDQEIKTDTVPRFYCEDKETDTLYTLNFQPRSPNMVLTIERMEEQQPLPEVRRPSSSSTISNSKQTEKRTK
jgi:hypothetical protein